MGTGRDNRVAPDGSLHAVSARGSMFGNRGALLDAHGVRVREFRERRWIVCVLEFRGRRRQQWQPRTYTELYFLDEATALAAGHRPCAECRRPAFEAFRTAWAAAAGLDRPPGAPAMDEVLHAQRTARGPDGRTHTAALDALPDGTVIAVDGGWWLVDGDALRRWSFEGYRTSRPRAGVGRTVAVVTPPATVAVLRAGYPAGLHPSARAGRRAGSRADDARFSRPGGARRAGCRPSSGCGRARPCRRD